MFYRNKFLWIALAVFIGIYGFWAYQEMQASKKFVSSEFQKKFTLVEDPIDVIIPCTRKDLATLDLCIEGIRKNGQNVRRVIILSPEKYTDKAEWFPEDRFPFNKKDIALALFADPERAENYLSLKKNRAGWLLQQLLKLYATQVIPNLSSNILLLDADTIFLSPVQFINEKGGSIFHPSLREYHLPYFKHGRRMLPGFHRLHPEYSGVAHHMLMQKSVLENLMQEVEDLHKKPFWQVFCALVDQKDIYHAGASEYEIYFNYALARTDQVSIETLKWINTADIDSLDQYRREGYHYISSHDYLREEM